MSDLNSELQNAVQATASPRQSVLHLQQLADEAVALRVDIIHLAAEYQKRITELSFDDDFELVTAMQLTKEFITSISALPPQIRGVRRGVQYKQQINKNLK